MPRRTRSGGPLFRQLGYTSIRAYAHHVLDLPIRQSRSLLQFGRSLPKLPTLDAAFTAGELGWTMARELLRVVTLNTEADWVACATACTSRQIEALVSRARVGESPPTAPPSPRGVSLSSGAGALPAQAARTRSVIRLIGLPTAASAFPARTIQAVLDEPVLVGLLKAR